MERLYQLPEKSELYRPVLDEFVHEVEKNELAEGLVLFGSSARGKAKPESDLDILAVVNQNWPDSTQGFNTAITKVRGSEAYRSLKEQGYDPQIYPFYIEKSQFDRPPLIACEMANHGVIIFDPKSLVKNGFDGINKEISTCKREGTSDGRIIWTGLPVARESALGLSIEDRLNMLKASVTESLEEAGFSLNRGINNLAVRRSQEAVELVMTKLLLEMGVHAPKDHDMGETVFEALSEKGIHVDPAIEQQIKEITLSLTRMRGHAMHQTVGYGRSVATEALSQAKRVVEFTENLSPFSAETQQTQSILTICGSMCKLFEMRESKAKLAQVPNWKILIPEVWENNQEEKIKRGEYRDTVEIKQKHGVIKDHHDKVAQATFVLIHNSDKPDRKGYIGANTFLEVGFAHVLNKPIYTLNNYKENTFMVDELDAIGAIVLDGDLQKMINYMESENSRNLKR
jgi:HEPN domain-containing protein